MISREEFEEWVNDHKDEAIDRIEADEMPLKKWLELFGKSMKRLHREDDVDEDDLDDMDY